MRPVVFVGPTLSGHPVLASRAFVFRPPASEGDVYRASLKRPAAIGLIDGQFENVPSVWHKEILWALSQGIPVFGAASMGALRASELDRFGMIGVGAIYEAYRDGRYVDDDEVAIVHAPRELRYTPLSLALADIRATLAAAQRAKILSPALARKLVRIAKTTFFKDRTWGAILPDGLRGSDARSARRVRHWIATNAVSQKETDALLLLERVRDLREPVVQPAFEFQNTVFWRELVARHSGAALAREKSTKAN